MCTNREVQRWLETGNGSGDQLTRGGTPAQARADLERAVRAHLQSETSRGGDTKFETRSRLVDDAYAQGLWLWLTTSMGRGIYPKGVIAVIVDHG